MAKYPPLVGPLRSPGRQTDDPSTIQLTVRIPRVLHKEVKVFCADHDTSVVAFIMDAMRHELALRTKKPT
jgi:hypothetical protein